MTFNTHTRLAEWHEIVHSKDTAKLSDFLADDILFYSPVLFKPKQGKMAAFIILSTVVQVFEDFVYHRQWLDDHKWALEFSAKIGDKQLKGIDLIEFNEAGQIVTFEVMVRPLNALHTLAAEMQTRLTALGVI